MRVAGDPRRIADLTYDELTRIPLFPTDAPGAAVAAPLPGSLENPPLVTTPDSAPEGYFQHVPLFADVLKVVAGRVPLIVEYKFDDNSKWDPRDVELMEKGDALLQAYSGAYVIESFNPAASTGTRRTVRKCAVASFPGGRKGRRSRLILLRSPRNMRPVR